MTLSGGSEGSPGGAPGGTSLLNSALIFPLASFVFRLFPISSLALPLSEVSEGVIVVRGYRYNSLDMTSRSPSAVTPFPKASSSAPPDTPAADSSSPQPPPQPVPFPSPQTFDIIPPLYGLLLRLLSPQTTAEAASGSNARVPVDTVGPTSAPSAAVPSHSHSTTATTDHHGVLGSGSNAPRPLDAKNLPTEANSIKIRIQKARAVVEGLPDVQRSVADQEREIEELEDRIGRSRSVISEFGRRAGRNVEVS